MLPQPSRRTVLSLGAAALFSPAGSTQLSSGPEVVVGLFTDLGKYSVDPATKALHTTGHSAPGVGSGRYVETSASRGRGYEGRTADGRWWRLAPPSGIANLAQMGGSGDGVHLADAAIDDLMDWCAVTGGAPDLGSGRVRLSKSLILPPGVCHGGDVTLDFSDMPIACATERACVVVKGGDIRDLPGLDAPAAVGSAILDFKAPHGLAAGQSIALLDLRDYSGNPWRPVYRAGQMNRVEEVLSARRVRLKEPNFREYQPRHTKCGLRPDKTWRWGGGRLTILASAEVALGLLLSDLDDVDFAQVSVSGARYASLSLRRCYGGAGRDLFVVQEIDSGEGGDYGLVIESSQNVSVDGRFHGRRHAVSQGPAADWGVMQYGCAASGHFTNDPASGAHALDAHGNSENYSYSGTCAGGLVFGGDGGHFRNLVITAPSGGGRVLASAWAGECHGFSFDFTGARLISPQGIDPYKTAPGHAVFDFGGNGGGYKAAAAGEAPRPMEDHGGRLNLSDAVIEAGGASHVIMVRNYGYAGGETLEVDLEGLRVVGDGRGLILVDHPHGKPISLVRAHAVSGVPVWRVDPATRLQH